MKRPVSIGDRKRIAATWDKRIKKAMKNAARFCDKYGIHDAQVSRWVNGRTIPSKLMVTYIEKALEKEGA